MMIRELSTAQTNQFALHADVQSQISNGHLSPVYVLSCIMWQEINLGHEISYWIWKKCVFSLILYFFCHVNALSFFFFLIHKGIIAKALPSYNSLYFSECFIFVYEEHNRETLHVHMLNLYDFMLVKCIPFSSKNKNH